MARYELYENGLQRRINKSLRLRFDDFKYATAHMSKEYLSIYITHECSTEIFIVSLTHNDYTFIGDDAIPEYEPVLVDIIQGFLGIKLTKGGITWTKCLTTIF